MHRDSCTGILLILLLLPLPLLCWPLLLPYGRLGSLINSSDVTCNVRIALVKTRWWVPFRNINSKRGHVPLAGGVLTATIGLVSPLAPHSRRHQQGGGLVYFLPWLTPP